MNVCELLKNREKKVEFNWGFKLQMHKPANFNFQRPKTTFVNDLLKEGNFLIKNILNYIQSSATTLPSQKKILIFQGALFSKMLCSPVNCCRRIRGGCHTVSVGTAIAAISVPWDQLMPAGLNLRSILRQFFKEGGPPNFDSRFSSVMSLGGRLDTWDRKQEDLSLPVDMSLIKKEKIKGKFYLIIYKK